MSDIITTLHPENDEDTNLYPNIKKENIPSKSINREKLSDEVNELLNNIGTLTPSGVDTSTNILAFTENKGIYVGSDTGYWYFWNGTQYIQGGVYQAIITTDDSIGFSQIKSEIVYNELISPTINYNTNAYLSNGEGSNLYIVSQNQRCVIEYVRERNSGLILIPDNDNIVICFKTYDNIHYYRDYSITTNTLVSSNTPYVLNEDGVKKYVFTFRKYDSSDYIGTENLCTMYKVALNGCDNYLNSIKFKGLTAHNYISPFNYGSVANLPLNANEGNIEIAISSRRAYLRYLTENLGFSLKIKFKSGYLVKCIYSFDTTYGYLFRDYSNDDLFIPNKINDNYPYYYISVRKTDNTDIDSSETIIDSIEFYYLDDKYDIYKLNNKLVDVENDLNIFKNRKPSIKGLYAIMSYNVGGWYDGSGVICPIEKQDIYLTLDKLLLDTYLPDYVCTQEYKEDFGDTNIKNALLKYYYDNNIDVDSDTTYNGKSINTNYRLFNTSSITFTINDSVNRNVFKGYTYINGKKVCILNVHLSTTDIIRNAQVTELLNIISNETYFILCGDFNADCSSVNDQNYIDVFKPFIDLGYNMANCSNFGFIPTYYSENQSRYLVIDNIITSSNINIKSVIVDEIKKDYDLPNRLDHMPLIAYIEIE